MWSCVVLAYRRSSLEDTYILERTIGNEEKEIVFMLVESRVCYCSVVLL